MRMYQSAWNKLKNNPTQPLVISAHPAYHRRIYKAIMKEKHIDTVYHLILADSNQCSKLSKISHGNALIIKLIITPAITFEGLF